MNVLERDERMKVDPPAERMNADTALILVIDEPFLHPAKVLLTSLEHHGSLQRCTKLVITTDDAVRQNQELRQMVDEIEFWSEKDLRVFSTIRGDQINPRLGRTFAPKFTFFKFSIFKERGFRRHIFIDADMVCHSALDEQLLSQDYDAKACMQFGKMQFPFGNEERADDQEEISRNFIRENSAPRAVDVPLINSGTLCFQGKALGNDAFEMAIATASRESFRDEQRATAQTLRNLGCTFLQLPIWYNARRRMFASLGETAFGDLESQVKLLHYTPGKPWKMDPNSLRSYDRVWHDYAAMLENSPAKASRRQPRRIVEWLKRPFGRSRPLG